MIQFLLSRRMAAVPALAAWLVACGLPAHAQPFSVPSHRIDGKLVFDGIPPVDAKLSARIRRYEEWRQATFLDWLPDGSVLLATRFGTDEQVHRVVSPLGMREQLTYGDGPVIEASAPRRGTGFVFVRQTDGYPQLFDYAGAGAARQITQGSYMHGSPVWSHDGKRVAFYGTDRTGVNDDIYVVNIAAGTRPQLVVAGSAGSWRPLDWSQDDGKLLLLNTLSPQKSALYVADASTGGLTPLALPQSRITAADFAPDGVGYYLISDAQSNFEQLLYFNPITKVIRRVSADVPWDVEAFAVGAGGHYVAYVVNDDGQSRLTVLDTLRNLEFKPPGLQDGRIDNVRFDGTGQKLAFSYESARSPRDVYVYDIAQGALRQWTRSEIGPIDAAGLAAAQVIHYPTWDRLGLSRRTLSAYVYLPRGPSPCPVLIVLPGGQELHSQSRPDWQPFIQFAVNDLGYAVIAPNVRGSSGYGKAFRALDGGRLRDDAVRDVGALLVWIGLQPGLDSHHVAVMGHGYGGFLALASLATYGDHLQGAIDVAGIANLVDFVGHSPAAERAQRVAEFGDVQDTEMRAFLDRISPLDNVALIHRPVLIVQGLDAPGSRAADAQQLVWRLRSERNQVWYLSASDAGNDFTTPLDRQAYLDTAAQFLEMLVNPREASR
jgi:dipeptidyl aminopeptidase/acylaminoacyl peptidase